MGGMGACPVDDATASGSSGPLAEWRPRQAERAPALAWLDQDDLCLPPPGGDDGLLTVDFRLTVFHVSQVSTRELTAFVKMGVVLYWDDPRMRGHTHPVLPPTLWGPTVSLRNAVGGAREDYEQFAVADPVRGRMKRIINIEACISVPMDLREFPFDVQTVAPEFVSISHWRQVDLKRHGSRPHGQDYVLRPVSDEKEGKMLMMLWSGEVSEWQMRGYTIVLEQEMPQGGFIAEKLTVRISLARNYNYYILKFLGPLVVLALCSFLVQRIAVDQIESRLKVWSAMFLAVFSMLSLQDRQVQPKLSFLTTLDQAVYLTLLAMVWVGVETWLVLQCWHHDERRAKQVDDQLAVAVPAGYIAAMSLLIIRPLITVYRKANKVVQL